MNIIGVQFKINSEDFRKNGYTEHIEKFYKKSEPMDILVFPEDIGLITAFFEIESKNIPEAMENIYRKNFEKIQNLQSIYPDISFPNLLFLSLTENFVENFYNKFSELSKKYSVYTITCNNMADFKKSKPVDWKVYNTCFVFDPKGNVLFKQKKVYLTDEEKNLGISPGSLMDVKCFKIGNIKFGIAISLDAFNPDYISRIAQADVIFQPDANPGKWNAYLQNGRWQPEEWMDSAYYIAQRLANVKYVINPMMVGSIFDITFEGESSITKKSEMNDIKMAYIGNIPTTGFEQIIPAKGINSEHFIPRELAKDIKIEFEEGVLEVDYKSGNLKM